MVMLNPWLTEAAWVSASVTVKFDVPAVLGIPEISPLLAVRSSPEGRVPLLMLHVYGPTPPLAIRLWS